MFEWGEHSDDIFAVSNNNSFQKKNRIHSMYSNMNRLLLSLSPAEDSYRFFLFFLSFGRLSRRTVVPQRGVPEQHACIYCKMHFQYETIYTRVFWLCEPDPLEIWGWVHLLAREKLRWFHIKNFHFGQGVEILCPPQILRQIPDFSQYLQKSARFGSSLDFIQN